MRFRAFGVVSALNYVQVRLRCRHTPHRASQVLRASLHRHDDDEVHSHATSGESQRSHSREGERGAGRQLRRRHGLPQIRRLYHVFSGRTRNKVALHAVLHARHAGFVGRKRAAVRAGESASGATSTRARSVRLSARPPPRTNPKLAARRVGFSTPDDAKVNRHAPTNA